MTVHDSSSAELQGTKDELYSVDKAAKELGAERDRLRAIVQDLVQYAGGMEYDTWRLFVKRAEEALAGAAPETTHEHEWVIDSERRPGVTFCLQCGAVEPQ